MHLIDTSQSLAARPLMSTGLRRAPRRWVGLLVGLALAAGGVVQLTPPAQAETLTTASETTSRAAVADILTQLRTKSRKSDPRYLKDNVWHDGSPDCFRCTLGPSVLAAAQGIVRSDTSSRSRAVATLDLAINAHQRRNGSYGPIPKGEGSADIQTVLFANSLAESYLVLETKLDKAHKKKWAASIAKSADWLITNGNTSYYVNGNINLAVAVNMDLTYRITGSSRFKTAAESSLAFAMNPDQTRWTGFGFHYTTTPTKADGSDGAGYFAEAGAGAPGYDPVYTLFQADMASFWFLLTKDPAAHRITNMLYNQLVPRVRISDWTIDVGGGTRRTEPDLRYGFTISALPVLALQGGRTDLKPLVASQTKAAMKEYRWATAHTSPGVSYNYGASLTPTYLAVTSTPSR